MRRRSIRKELRALLLDIARRSLLGIVAAAIFFGSCTKYEVFPQELPPRSRSMGPVAGSDESRHIALPLSAEDIDYWLGLQTMLQQVLSNPQWAEAYLKVDTVAISGLERPVVLDDFSRSLLRLFANHELRTAIARRDYSAMAQYLQAHRDEVCMTDDTQLRLASLLKANPELAATLGDGTELQPDSIVFPFVIAIVAVAIVAVAVGYESAVGFHYIAACATKVLGCEDRMVPFHAMAVALMAEHPEASLEVIEQIREDEIDRMMQALRTHRIDLLDKLGEDELRKLVEQML